MQLFSLTLSIKICFILSLLVDTHLETLLAVTTMESLKKKNVLFAFPHSAYKCISLLASHTIKISRLSHYSESEAARQVINSQVKAQALSHMGERTEDTDLKRWILRQILKKPLIEVGRCRSAL